jgi:tRNA(Ser,Leu) C12 N-acetylase TAN1
LADTLGMLDALPTYNLLVSYSLEAGYLAARDEIDRLLRRFGDAKALIERSPAAGLMGVRTALEPREAIEELRELAAEDPTILGATLRWMPVDGWCHADLPAIQRLVEKLKYQVNPGERWMPQVERRQGALLAVKEVTAAVVPLIREEVGLERPEKVLRVELLGPWAGVAVVRERDVFSVAPLD